MTDRFRQNPAGRPSRRELLRALGAAPLAASIVQAAPAVQAQTSSAKAHIVIAGSGLGGIAVASRLRKLMPQARITLVDAKQEHNYQPGYTLVATGVWPIEKVRDRNADFQPRAWNGCRRWWPSSIRPTTA